MLYAPFAEVLAARFGTSAGEGLDESQEKIVAGVAEVMPPARVTETAHLIGHLMRVPFPDSPVLGPLADSPQQLEARSFLALRRFLAADAASAPLVLCFENLETFEPESINLLHYLAAGLSHSPVVVLGTARESVFSRHPSTGKLDVAIERIDLGPLEQPEAENLLRELCRPLEHVSPRLLEHAAALGGSPRALVELVRYLLESDLIVADSPTAWRTDDRALAAATLPATHQELVAERIRIMAPADRELLQMAAVIGETFWLDGVVALLRVRDQGGADPDGPTLAQIAAAGDRSRATAAAVIHRLVEREWVQPVEPSSVAGEFEYRFNYPTLWSAVYEGIDPAARRAAHRTVAQYLELRPEGRGAMAQEEIGRHLELGGDGVGAAGRYRRAADFARASFTNERAIRLYRQALDCMREADLAARIDVWHDLGSVYELRGDYEAALGAFERMLRLAWVCASRSKAAVSFNKMGRVWRRKGDIKLALEYLERGLELFEQADDQRGIAGSLDDIGSVLHLLGRTDEAFEKVSQALAALGAADRRSRARSLSNLGNIQRDRGQFAESLGCHQEALEIRRAIGDRVGVIASRSNLAVLAFQRGDRAESRLGWEQALGEAETIGALPLQAVALCNLGELALGEGRSDEARRRLEESLAIAQEIDDRRIEGEATRNLALLEHAGGDASRAQALALRAHEVAAAAGLRDTEGRALLTLGQVFAAQSLVDTDENTERGRARAGQSAMADVYFARGIDLLRALGNESELARGLERFGRYKIESGELPAGRDLLREAVGIFQRLGMAQPGDLAAVLAAR